MCDSGLSEKVKRPLAELDNSDITDEQSCKSFKAEHVKMPNRNIFTPSRKLARSPDRNSASSPRVSDAPEILHHSDASYSVTTRNSFDVLATASECAKAVNSTHHASSAGDKPQRKQKINIPPFVFTSAAEFKCGLDIVYKHAKANHYIKYMRVGTKIQVTTMESYIDIDKEMSLLKIKYFTHDLMPERANKFVLNGLPYMEINELKAEIESNGLEPLNIQSVSAKNPRYDKEHIYFVTFPSTINLSDVQKVNALNHTIVKWYKYINKQKGPTQCRKCLIYGHGMRNCHLLNICAKCGQSGHSEDTCLVVPEQFKCSNCKGNHLATDPSCKSRADFMAMRVRLSSANNKKIAKKPSEFVRSGNDAFFPALRTKTSSFAGRSKPESSNPVAGDWIFKDRTTFAPTRTTSYRDALKNQAPEEETLFSSSEILQITKDVLIGLAACKSKQQQLEVIFQICATYLHGP